MNNKCIYLLLFMPLFSTVCEDKKNQIPTGENIIPSEEITLETCNENINDNTPSFFMKYFKCVDIELTNDQIIITTDGVPPHRSWYFSEDHPNNIVFESQGDRYEQNHNFIYSQNFVISIPVSPSPKGIQITESGVDGDVGSDAHEFSMGPVGVALDGVTIFNPLAAPGHDIEDEKFSFDYYNGHPEMSGTYHYHTTTKGPLEVLEYQEIIQTPTPGLGEVEVYGIMCDGTVILGCTELDGSSPNSMELDAQNGHIHDLIDDEGTIHFTERYHTHICPDQFPNHNFTPEIQYYDDCNRSF